MSFLMQGLVSFDAKTGNRIARIFIYQIQDFKEKRIGEYLWKKDNITWLDNIKFSGGHPPLATTQTLYITITMSPAMYIVIMTVSVIGLLFSLVSIVFNVFYRHLKFIKLSSPNINNIIAIGCALEFINLIFLANGSYHNYLDVSICWIRLLSLSVGFSMSFGAMFAKTWRVHKIFTNKTTAKVIIKDWHLYVIILAMVLIDLFVIAIWSFIDKMHINTIYLWKEEDVKQGMIYQSQMLQCHAKYFIIWTSVLLAIKGIILLFGIFFAWETRNVYVAALNDSKQIAICVYNVTVLGIVGIGLNFVLPNDQISLKRSVEFVCVGLSALSTLGLVFVKKIYLVIHHGPQHVDSMEAHTQTMQQTGYNNNYSMQGYSRNDIAPVTTNARVFPTVQT